MPLLLSLPTYSLFMLHFAILKSSVISQSIFIWKLSKNAQNNLLRKRPPILHVRTFCTYTDDLDFYCCSALTCWQGGVEGKACT